MIQKTSVDSLGNRLRMICDALGRVETIIQENPIGQVILEQDLRYDAVGNKVLERNGTSVIAWEYGPMNRLEEVVEAYGSPLQKRTYYAYDSQGYLAFMIKPDGIEIAYGYDGEGNRVYVASSDGSIQYRYSYDSRKQVIEAKDLSNNALIIREYDGQGRLVSEKRDQGTPIRKEYDLQGRTRRIVLPDQSSVSYEYDAAYLRAVKRYSSTGALLYQHSYDSYSNKGKLESSTLAADLGFLRISYDDKLRCRSIESPYWSEKIPEGGYSDTANLIKMSVSDSAGTYTAQFKYDEKGQLIEEEGLAKCHAYASQNELFQFSQKGEYSLEYDANGNIIRKGSQRYRYDALNRLIETQIDESHRYSFSYDPFHRLVTTSKDLLEQGKWKQQEVWHHLYDGDNDIGTFDHAGKLFQLRVLGTGHGAEIGAAVALELNHKLYVPVHDHRGSLCCLIDAESREPREFYRYSGFGEQEIYDNEGNPLDASSLMNPWGFASKRTFRDAGCVFFGKRFLDPSLGQWLTQDPLGFINGPNRYAYVGNNPMTHFDLYGQFSFSEFMGDIITGTLHAFTKIGAFFEQWYKVMNPEGLSYFNYVRPELESLSKDIFGTTFLLMMGFWVDPLHAQTHGEGEFNDSVRITMINGILNQRRNCVESAQTISTSHGGINIHYIYRPTAGWAADIMNGFLAKCGFISPAARQLAEVWKMLIQDMGGIGNGGTIIHYAHSIGGKETMLATSLLTPEEQKMIRVVSMGSASAIPDDGFESVVNYMSVCDGIWLLDPVGFICGLLEKQGNVEYLGSWWGIPFIDHSFRSGSYGALLKILGQQFIEKYVTIGR